jgi:hypothetical protein
MDLPRSHVDTLGPKASGYLFPVAHYTFRTTQVTNYYPQQQQQQQQQQQSTVTQRPSQGAA